MLGEKQGKKIFGDMQSNPLLITLLIIICISSIGYFDFIFKGRLYVLCADAYDQFVPEINLLRLSMINGEIPMWSFAKGLGQQLTVGNPNWSGDIFTYLAILLGKDKFMFFFGIIMQLKIIISGLFFYLFLKELKVAQNTRIIFSILYAFNGHMILRGIWIHYATEVVFVAIWLWAIERFYENKNKILFSICFALLVLSRNAAYIYIYSGLTFVYIGLRFSFENGWSTKGVLKKVRTMIPHYILGLGLSAVLILPGIYGILNSQRISEVSLACSNPFQVSSLVDMMTVFAKSFSYGILGGFNTTGSSGIILEDQVMYCGILSMLIWPQIIYFKKIEKREKNVIIFMLFLILLYYMFPYIRYFTNAFSSDYFKTSSFWSIVFLIISGVYVLDKFEKGHEVLNKKVLSFTIIIYVLVFIGISIYRPNFLVEEVLGIVLCIITIYLVVFIKFKNNKSIYYVILGICCIEITINLVYQLNDKGMFNIRQENAYIDPATGSTYDDGTIEVVKELREVDDGFYRIIKTNIDGRRNYNDSQIQGYYGTTAYVSLGNSYITRFYDLFEITSPNSSQLSQFNDRTYLNSLLSVKYFLKLNTLEQVPNGFEYYFTSSNGIEVYKNKYFIPFGIVYEKTILENEVMDLNAAEKEVIALYAAIIKSEEDGKASLSYDELRKESNLHNKSVNQLNYISAYNMEVIKNNFPQYFSYNSLNNDPMISVEVEGTGENSSYILKMEIDSPIDSRGEVYYASNNEVFDGDKLEIFEIKEGTHAYSISFDAESEITNLRIDIGDTEETFIVRNIELISTQLTEYYDRMLWLKKNALEITRMEDNKIDGNVTITDDEGFLFLSIPYDKGWKVKANGQERELVVVNGGFSGLFLEKGSYTISMKYTTPWLISGTIVSLSSLVICILVSVSNVLKKLNNKYE